MESETPILIPPAELRSDELLVLHQNDSTYLKGPLSNTRGFEVTPGHIESSSLPSSPPPGSPSENLNTADKVPSEMPFSSSPLLYPVSSSPAPQVSKKRKLFQTLEPLPPSKKVKSDAESKRQTGQDAPAARTVSTENSVQLTNGANGADLADDVLDIDHVLAKDGSEAEPILPTMPRAGGRPRLFQRLAPGLEAASSNGAAFRIAMRSNVRPQTYEEIVAQRSTTKEGRAQKAYYGIEIHDLIKEARIQRELDEARIEYETQQTVQQAEDRPVSRGSASSRDQNKGHKSHLMWTEKYRATKFADLVGDERTHRSVLRWLKSWDEMVFPEAVKARKKRIFEDKDAASQFQRKILLLTGPPGLGKTTLAHVCAKKAGYETLEINASDDRSRDVVRGRIKDVLSTDNVRGIIDADSTRKAGKPICVVVDEVDGVTTGSGGTGEGGFMKALIDLIQLDQQNSATENNALGVKSRKKKGDKFRMRRPLILVCNDVYAPSLRPLRSSSLAEIVHVRKPALDKVVLRLKTVFESENVLYDNDAVRRICESAWGMGTRKQSSIGGHGAGEGDLRGILVQAEWMAHKFRASSLQIPGSRQRLTRKWVEGQIGEPRNSNGQKGLGRGGTREVIDRIFIEGAGLPNLPTALSTEDARMVAESKGTALGVADIRKRAAVGALRHMIDTCGEHDRLMTECFATYPTQMFQDDTCLSKPNAAYDWLHFHDCLSHRLYGGQEWELGPYMNTSACAFHTLFASVDKGNKSWGDDKKEEEEAVARHPYSGHRADFAAFEAEKQNKTILTELQASLSAPLLRLFSSIGNMATELVPNVNRMLSPDVKPVVIGGHAGAASVASVRKETEKGCVQNAVRVMHGLELRFEKVKLEVDASAGPGNRAAFVYRMEPPLDALNTYHLDKSTAAASNSQPTRYAVRQVLEQELHKEKMLQNSLASQKRSGNPAGVHGLDNNKENEDPSCKATGGQTKASDVKRDFFGRAIKEDHPSPANGEIERKQPSEQGSEKERVWVSFNEGFSNAVRKPITLKELMDGF